MSLVRAKNIEQDLSMEEILASIRRIIAEDQAIDDDSKKVSSAADMQAAQSLPKETYSYDGYEANGISHNQIMNEISNPRQEAVQPDIPATDSHSVHEAAIASPSATTSVKPAQHPPVFISTQDTKAPSPPVNLANRPDNAENLHSDEISTAEALSSVTHEEPVTSRQKGLDSAALQLSSLLSKQTDDAVISSFKKLNRISSSSAQQVTVEDFLQQMLRPMLKEWLDINLPRVVEKLVQAEIERAIRSGNMRIT